MSNVVIEIAGRKFTVACGQGEQRHIEMLGRIIDSKIDGMPGLATQSEARCLLYAALPERSSCTSSASRSAASTENTSEAAGELERLAETLEGLATRLES